jgi:hypothetical protein
MCWLRNDGEGEGGGGERGVTSRFSELIAEQSMGSLLLVLRIRSGRNDMNERKRI